jgi:hypothetical protein
VQFHVTKLDVLKVPLKGLLGGFHAELSDLVHASNIPGVQIINNDILFDTQKLLPPPQIHGQLTAVRVSPLDASLSGVPSTGPYLCRINPRYFRPRLHK